VLTEQVIADGSLETAPEGFRFGLRLPWYRALPLACVEGLEVTLDGESAATADLTFEIDGESYALGELPDLHDQFWYVTDAASITVRCPEILARADHELDVTIAVRIPYIVESGVPLVMRERCVKRLQMTEGGAT
jgi:hypothetical protein